MNKPELVYVTYIRSTPEKTWNALTQPEFARLYWGGMAAVSDWKEGSSWQLVTPDNVAWVTGEVVESRPYTRLVVSWAEPDDLTDMSRVTYEIEPLEDEVRLTVTHGHFKADSPMVGKVSKGWPHRLSSLKSFLETGTGLKFGCGG